MTTPRPAAGPPSRSGVRRGGDAYQNLITWGAALRLIQPASDITQLEIEINGAGNVDDVVLRSHSRGDRFCQVKWATETARMVDEDFMTKPAGRGKTLLQKLYASFRLLHDPQRPPTLELLTNRSLDPTHPLLGHVDGRTDLLVPYAAQAHAASEAGEQLQHWTDHIGCDREQLLEMLAHLLIRPGLTVSSEQDRTRSLMAAAGLRQDDDALEQGLNIVTAWVNEGQRIIQPDDLHHIIDSRRLRAGNSRAILLVQAIDRDSHPDDAAESLNWVHLYEGDKPSVRCRPRQPSDWRTMADELAEATHTLEAAGWRDILLRGAMRQATFFLVGAYLPAVRGKVLNCIQNQQLWSSDHPRVTIPTPTRECITMKAGTDIAIAVGIAVDPTEAVVKYARAADLPVEAVTTFMPAEGAHDQVVRGPGEAVAYAQTIRNAVRVELEARPHAERIHLFLAGPGGLALLLGHRWNRLRPTTIYEHLGVGRGYTPAFEVEA